MKFGKISAAACMAITAVGITAATAHGEPAVAAAPPAVVAQGNATSGLVQGINYKTSVAPAEKTITMQVDKGRFEVAADGAAVLLKTDDGAVVDQVPLRSELAGKPIQVAQQISENGRDLTLQASMAPEDLKEVGELRDVDGTSWDRLMFQVNKNLPGVIIGGVIGAFLPFLFFITIPAGMVIGGYIMGGQEFLDAVIAVVTGQP
ncbi:hypothetical protein ACFVMC_08490 [Nocardia sp. NPDC127579]|uniref:hypothetical protein n=1 Tax=Nocardia sp. NPDC127579 TaxID=3345402 RepID=UPI00363013E9